MKTTAKAIRFDLPERTRRPISALAVDSGYRFPTGPGPSRGLGLFLPPVERPIIYVSVTLGLETLLRETLRARIRCNVLYSRAFGSRWVALVGHGVPSLSYSTSEGLPPCLQRESAYVAGLAGSGCGPYRCTNVFARRVTSRCVVTPLIGRLPSGRRTAAAPTTFRARAFAGKPAPLPPRPLGVSL